MAVPITCSPMLYLLALRASAVLGTRREDAWAGSFLAMERAIGEGSERRPEKWLQRWPAAAQAAFWKAANRSWDVEDGVTMDAIRSAASVLPKGAAWGEGVVAPIQFGVTPVAFPKPLAETVRVIGVVPEALPAGWSDETLACLEMAKSQRIVTWVDAVDTGLEWTGAHWQQCHRLGVAAWLRAPASGSWGRYGEFLAQQVAWLVRQPEWEQWVWPLSELLEACFEDVLLYGKPHHRSISPSRGEGAARASHWTSVRKQVWESATSALGGAGALEEVLVASVLANSRLLLR